MNLRRNKSLELFNDLAPSTNFSKQNVRYSNLFGPNCLENFYKKMKLTSDLQTKINLKEFFDEKILKYHRKGTFKTFNMNAYLKSKKEEDKKEEMKLALRKKKIHIYVNERTIENVQRIKDRIEKFKNETPFCKYNPKYEYISKRIPNVYIVPEHVSHSVSKRDTLNNSNENALTGTNENCCSRLKRIKHNTLHLPYSLKKSKEVKRKLFENYKMIKNKSNESNAIHKSGSLPLITTTNRAQFLSLRKQSRNCSNIMKKIQTISIEEKIMTPVNKKTINFYL